MGTDTKGIISKTTTIDDIHKALADKYGEVKHYSATPPFKIHKLTFKDGNDDRILTISYHFDSTIRDNAINGVWLSLGFWGNSIEIIKYLCEKFGGFIDENDCDSEDFYPINLELYEKSLTEFDKEERRKKPYLDKLAKVDFSQFSSARLKTILELIEETK